MKAYLYIIYKIKLALIWFDFLTVQIYKKINK